MKLKVLVMLIGFALLATLTVCVTVYAYNAWTSGSRNAAAGTISMSAGANGHGLVDNGSVKAQVTLTELGKNAPRTWTETDQIVQGKKSSVQVPTKTGRDNKSGTALGYVKGDDVHDWEHIRKVTLNYSPNTGKFTKKIAHTITPPP